MKRELEKLIEIAEKLSDKATKIVGNQQLDEFLSAMNNVGNSLSIALSILEKESLSDLVSSDLVRDLEKQISEHPILSKVPEEVKALVIQKMLNAGRGVASKEDLISFLQKSLRSLSNEDLVKKAYGKDEIIRVGRSVIEDKVGDSVLYSRGLEILTEETVEPENLNNVYALIIKRTLRDPKEIEQLVYQYYGI